ncbi:hypothetical protein [Methylobacterium sp. JK268]
MRRVLAIAALAAALPAAARAEGRFGGVGIQHVDARFAPRPVRTASAETEGPVPTTTGSTAASPPAAAKPGPAKPSRPWCEGGRVFGSGSGFCEIN